MDRCIDNSLLTLCTANVIASYHSRAQISDPQVLAVPTRGHMDYRRINHRNRRTNATRRSEISDRHQFFVAQSHLSNLEYQFFVIRDLVDRVKHSLPGGLEWTVAVCHPGSGRQCDSAAIVRHDSQSGERPMSVADRGALVADSPCAHRQRNTRPRSPARFSDAPRRASTRGARHLGRPTGQPRRGPQRAALR